MHSSSPLHGNMYVSNQTQQQQQHSLTHVQHLLGSLDQHPQSQQQQHSPHQPPPPGASSSGSTKAAHSSKEEEDVSHVRWSVELVMILVRNISQDRVLIQSLIQNELSKSKHQNGEVRDSTIYQYINRIKRWAKGAYEADLRSGGIARKELQQRDRRLTESEEVAKADFIAALKKEFKSMTFNSSQILEIINLGRTLKEQEERGEAKGERRRTPTAGTTPVSMGASSTSGLAHPSTFDDYGTSKKRKVRYEHEASSGGGGGHGHHLGGPDPIETRALSSAVGDVVAQAIADYTKVTIKATQDTTQTFMSAMQNFMTMQTQAEQRRIDREERDREERRKERAQDRKILRKLAEIKGISSFGDDSE